MPLSDGISSSIMNSNSPRTTTLSHSRLLRDASPKAYTARSSSTGPGSALS
jgi:hypothetical protein